MQVRGKRLKATETHIQTCTQRVPVCIRRPNGYMYSAVTLKCHAADTRHDTPITLYKGIKTLGRTVGVLSENSEHRVGRYNYQSKRHYVFLFIQSNQEAKCF